MGFKHFVTMNFIVLVMVTHFDFSLALDSSDDFNQNNNYEKTNNENFDTDSNNAQDPTVDFNQNKNDEDTNNEHFDNDSNNAQDPSVDLNQNENTNNEHLDNDSNDAQDPTVDFNQNKNDEDTNNEHFDNDSNNAQDSYYDSNENNNYEDTNNESEPTNGSNNDKENQWEPEADSQNEITGSKEQDEKDKDCWMTLNAADYFKAMDNLDDAFRQVRQDYQMHVGDAMDRQMLDELLGSGGAAPRAIHNFGGERNRVPAGINLGGYCMMREKDSILFFHRMKLRNSTYFTTNYIHNDFENMLLIADISLNDLHLLGAYERSATHQDPSLLYYRPSYGTIQVLLRNVSYKMEGRMRMMADRLTIELVTSELVVNDDILMSYLNTNVSKVPEYTVKLEPRRLDDFLRRLKTDLDLWLKDFFNDFFMYFQLPEYDSTGIQEAEKNKTIMMNEYVNYAVNSIRQKIYNVGGHVLTLPKFTIFSVPNMILKINSGVLRGVDSMYQRSVGTGKKNGNVRSVDAIVGFSKLKAEYKFEAVLPNGTPPLTGNLVLSADELTTHMGLTLVKDPESLDLNFDFIQQMKPESLSIEGPTNRLLTNFKHLLEHQIISLITNSMMHNIKMLNTLTRCVPFIYGHFDYEAPDVKHNLAGSMKPQASSEQERTGHKGIEKMYLLSPGYRHKYLDRNRYQLYNH